MYWLCQDSCIAILSAYYAFAEYYWWWGALICNVEGFMDSYVYFSDVLSAYYAFNFWWWGALTCNVEGFIDSCVYFSDVLALSG